MKKISYICDCCGKDATINYYTIDFKQHNDNLGRITMKGAMRNNEKFFRVISDKDPIYCEKCISHIETLIENFAKLTKKYKSELPFCVDFFLNGGFKK